MDIKNYREQVDREVQQAKAERELRASTVKLMAAGGASRSPADVALDKTLDLASRISAIQHLKLDRATGDASIPVLIQILGDPTEPIQLRQAALQAMKLAEFIPTLLAPHRPAYFQALRSLMRTDDPDLREQALEVLAMGKDAEAQNLLLDGLTGASRPLVSPARAIQFLGYDLHGGYFPVLQKIASETKDPEVRHEAVRFLASDPESKDLLRGFMQDKELDTQTRALGAIGLQSLDPAAFATAARSIVEDDQEDEAVRASCLGALSHFPEYRSITGDPNFVQKVRQLESKAQSEHLRNSAARFNRLMR